MCDSHDPGGSSGKGPEQGHPFPPSDQEKVATSRDPLHAGVTVVAAPRGTVHAGVTVIAAPRDTIRIGVTVVAAPKNFIHTGVTVVATPRGREPHVLGLPRTISLSGPRRHSRRRERCTGGHWLTVTRPRIQRLTRARSGDS